MDSPLILIWLWPGLTHLIRASLTPHATLSSVQQLKPIRISRKGRNDVRLSFIMARYVDGFVIPIKKNKLTAYKKMAIIGRNIWMKFGALDYYECVADDTKMPYGGTPLPKMAKLKAGETVVFSFIVFKSKAHRNAVNKKVHEYLAEKYANVCVDMPFDTQRASMAGCKVIVRG